MWSVAVTWWELNLCPELRTVNNTEVALLSQGQYGNSEVSASGSILCTAFTISSLSLCPSPLDPVIGVLYILQSIEASLSHRDKHQHQCTYSPRFPLHVGASHISSTSENSSHLHLLNARITFPAAIRSSRVLILCLVQPCTEKTS